MLSKMFQNVLNYKSCVCIIIALYGFTLLADDKKSISVEEAVRIVNTPSQGDDTGSRSPFELQVNNRLSMLGRYKYNRSDNKVWRACLRNEKQSMYARLCAAYFLLPEAGVRRFIEAQLKSKNLRYRYNASEILHFSFADKLILGKSIRKSTRKWAVELAIKLLKDGSIDGSGVRSTPRGTFPDGDRDDIMFTPIDSICWGLRGIKAKQKVPALIEVLRRRPQTGGAVCALGESGDPRASKFLLHLLKSKYYHYRVIEALGQLKCREAVPIFIQMLNKHNKKAEEHGNSSINDILEALLAIRDKRAIICFEF